MDDESRIRALVEEVLGADATPEEACREWPELLGAVRSRLERVRVVQAQIGEIFPALGNADGGPTGFRRPSRTLPTIPGYEVLEMLGAGGMGVVYRARHTRLNRVVAIKMLLAGGYAGERELERFKREAQAVAALRHPNIVAVYDTDEHDGFPYFAMEFMEGGTLTHSLAGAPQTARRASGIIGILARAVHAAHQAGIVHRDLKPGNVLLTSDGTLKIADFGLARRLDGAAEPTVTLAGARIGTPSYMSPEQAAGGAHAVGTASDIYSLGAILYEALTGRPPFRGESAAETERQVIQDEPVRPTRLNPRVPRDLETICLKCLRKEPARRYASAAALAEDLGCFEEGRPIAARPVGWGERAWRWGRRNPSGAALLVTALVLVGVASGGGVWLVRQRADARLETVRQGKESSGVIGAATAQADRLSRAFAFSEARAVLDRAGTPLDQGWRSLDPGARDGLRHQLHLARVDVDLAERLNAARGQAASIFEGRARPVGAEPLYASAFADAGLGRAGDPVDAVAAAVRASPLHAELVAAIDDWASITGDTERRAWLLAVARGADPDTVRDRLRRPELWQDGEELARVTEGSNIVGVSPQLATALARVARAHHRNALPMLMATQALFPQDFGVNYEIGYALCRADRGVEGLGYFRAALAVRPTAAVSYNGVGFALVSLDRLDEALGHYQEAVRLDPKYAAAQYNLADVLHKKGRLDEAVGHYQEALGIDPDLAAAHIGLGALAGAQGRLDDALEQYRAAVRIDPGYAMAHDGLGYVLRIMGRLEEATREGEEAVRLDPNKAGAHNNLGYVLYQQHRVEEGIEHLRRAISLDPKDPMPHHNLAGALASKGLLDEAIEEYQRALKLEPKLVPAHSNLALVLRAQGRLDEAISQLQEAIRLDPKDGAAHINLAKNLRDTGRYDEAVEQILEGSRVNPSFGGYPDMLADDLYIGACRHIDAAANPGAPLPAGVQAGPGGDLDPAGHRERALKLLRATMKLTREIVKDRKVAARPLAGWQTDAALASVRETSELAKLPEAEREQWQRLWADVAAAIDGGVKPPEAEK